MTAMQAAERGGYNAWRLVDIPEPRPQADAVPAPTPVALRQRCGPVGGEERAGYIAGAGGHEEGDKGGDLGARAARSIRVVAPLASVRSWGTPV
jgi:hypothetical protein